jgi:hypothetical protein
MQNAAGYSHGLLANADSGGDCGSFHGTVLDERAATGQAVPVAFTGGVAKVALVLLQPGAHSLTLCIEGVTGPTLLELVVRAPVVGDLDADGRITPKDLAILAVNLKWAAAEANPACDLNGDGLVDLLDLVTLARKIDP